MDPATGQYAEYTGAEGSTGATPAGMQAAGIQTAGQAAISKLPSTLAFHTLGWLLAVVRGKHAIRLCLDL
jgi:hypothetical protein